MLVLSSTTVFAQSNEIIVAIDSERVEFTEESGHPFVDENSRTLVPFRKALESYGATVDWNNDERIAIAEKDEIKVEVPIDQSYILVNGEQKATDTQAKIVNGRTYLPIRAVIEAFGSSVEWDAALKTVVITTTPVDAKAIFTVEMSMGQMIEDVDLAVRGRLPIYFHGRPGGMTPDPAYIVQMAKDILDGKEVSGGVR